MTLTQPISNSTNPLLIKTLANIISTQLITQAQKSGKSINQLISKSNLIMLAQLFSSKQINNQGLHIALEHAAGNYEQSISEIVQKMGLIQVSDDNSILAIIQEIIQQNPKQVEEFKSGKTAVVGFLVGQGMKISGGKADPQKLKELLTRELA